MSTESEQELEEILRRQRIEGKYKTGSYIFGETPMMGPQAGPAPGNDLYKTGIDRVVGRYGQKTNQGYAIDPASFFAGMMYMKGVLDGMNAAKIYGEGASALGAYGISPKIAMQSYGKSDSSYGRSGNRSSGYGRTMPILSPSYPAGKSSAAYGSGKK